MVAPNLPGFNPGDDDSARTAHPQTTEILAAFGRWLTAIDNEDIAGMLRHQRTLSRYGVVCYWRGWRP